MPIVKRIDAVPKREVTEFVISLRKHEDADFNSLGEEAAALGAIRLSLDAAEKRLFTLG